METRLNVTLEDYREELCAISNKNKISRQEDGIIHLIISRIDLLLAVMKENETFLINNNL
jgi:hypothetical protein